MKVKATIASPLSGLTQSMSYQTSEVPWSKDHQNQISGCALPCNNRAKEWRNHVLYCQTRPHTDEDMKKELPKCGT